MIKGMDHQISKPNAPLEAHNMRGMTIRNSVEKLECEKRQKIIEKQRSYFVRQHSRDENEIKQILLRLQQEQETMHDEQEDSTVHTEAETSTMCDPDKESSERDEVVNPYPLVIVPKYGSPTPLKNKTRDETGSPPRVTNKSDSNDQPNKSSKFRATVIAASFINKLHAPIAARKGGKSPFKEGDNALWVGDPEYISSIRRPRKSITDMNHQKNIYRAKSDLHRFEVNNPSSQSGSTVNLRGETPRSKHRDNVGELHITSNTSPDEIISQEIETSPKFIRKLSKERQTFEKTHSNAIFGAELNKSPRSRRGSLEKCTRAKSNVERNQLCSRRSKSRQDLPKSDDTDGQKLLSVGEKTQTRKSSLKKKKEDNDATTDRPKKISFADESIPKRSGSLKERKAAVSGRPRSSSGST
ncbi:uncharacterized protein LOC133172892 [Saccostrea echinata]|uniref:uncharacterized protein LOC133172892 n=1 Tax=Saccostrea echinata TaxID=191078 RepID=UPI002A7F5BFD|nr:uncharacterized protein LOC133172892 [Saccostrea echinata]